MQDHPRAPKFTDREAVPLLEAAIAEVKAGKGNIERGSEPPALAAAYKRVNAWGYLMPFIFTGHRARRSILEDLEALLKRAKGEDRACNSYIAEQSGWSTVRLSPEEQAIITAHRSAPDIIAARNLVPNPPTSDTANHPKREQMKPLLHEMLDSALTMGYATGSIGSTHVETAGGYEFAVTYFVRRTGRVHDVCAASPTTACSLCEEQVHGGGRLVLVARDIIPQVHAALEAELDKVRAVRAALVSKDDGSVAANKRTNDLGGQMFGLSNVLETLKRA